MADDTTTSVLERTYTIPLRPAFRHAPGYKKANRAVKAVRAFLEKHMKSEDVRLGQHLNEFLWRDGIKNPPPRVTVKAVRDAEGVVRAELEGKAYKESVKPTPKEEEPASLKDKLTSTLKKDEKTEAVPAAPQATPAKEQGAKQAEAKPVAAKPAAGPKSSSPASKKA